MDAKKIYRILLYAILIAVILAGCQNKSTDPPVTPSLLERLQSLPNCSVVEIDPPEGAHYSRAFQITIVQPVDHANPNGQSFEQRLFLSHVDESAPMALVTWGYDVTSNASYELAEMLQANQLLAAYRYTGDNRPNPVDWDYLTIEQASGDFHVIADIFKDIYTGPWVNFGYSKSAGAALHHRRFHPDDVLATVAVVPGVFISTHDPRVDDFLTNTVGTEECRDKIREFQRLALTRRDSLLPIYEEYVQDQGYSYSRIGGVGIAFEYLVLEYGYIFWQYLQVYHCDLIPDSTVSNSDLFIHLQSVSDIDFLRDEICVMFEPTYYQFHTETGYYGYATEHLDDLLIEVDDPNYEHMAPVGVPLVYDPAVMADMKQWLETDGQNIIYIYGEHDPLTATAISSPVNSNSFSIIQPGGNHLLFIEDLNQRDLVLDSLGSWLQVTVGP
ncbi:MAG: hypothetical protein GY839_21120 [candidate division Zixibacteria bacterium]|nr:hypothetical protein [candidate division Zixibacteria bacterium]